MKRSSSHFNSSKGITAVELLIAVAILAVLGGAAMPSFLNLLQQYRFNAAARQIATDVRLAQSLAVSRGLRFRLIAFDRTDGTRPNSYRLEGSNTGTAWPAVIDTPATNPLVYNDWINLAAQYSGVAITATDQTIYFDPRGTRVNGAGGDASVVTLSNGTGTMSIQVSSVGRVTAVHSVSY